MSHENQLFPVFLKLDQLRVLVVGGGNVALEKISALLRNSPQMRITVVAGYFRPELVELVADNPRIRLIPRNFIWNDLDNRDIVLLTTDNPELHHRIHAAAQARHLLINVADTPDLCDFYLGAVVQKGDLKIGISTNGKSPTFAKRLREYLEEALPDQVQDLLGNLQLFRNTLKGDFAHKVAAMNTLTLKALGKE